MKKEKKHFKLLKGPSHRGREELSMVASSTTGIVIARVCKMKRTLVGCVRPDLLDRCMCSPPSVHLKQGPGCSKPGTSWAGGRIAAVRPLKKGSLTTGLL